MNDQPSEATRLRDALGELFSKDVVAVIATPDMAEEPLLEAEAVGIGRMVTKRRREFTAGRSAARAALARLGVTGHALTVGPKREPLWPEGVMGSISHCDGLCVVAVARVGPVRSLGLDVEPAAPLPPGVEAYVCTDLERPGVTKHPLDGKVVFCAKESLYKAWYPVTREPLEFQEVSVTIDHEDGTWSAVIGRTPSCAFPTAVEGRFRIAEGYVLTALEVPSADRHARGGPA